MKNEVTFREICKGEEAEACRLVIECFNGFVAPDYSDEGVKEFLKYINPDSMQRRLVNGDFVLVALDGDLLIGIIEVCSNNHVALFFVNKRFQRRGIARRLLELAIRKCREVEKEVNEIDVNSSPYAVEIYEKLGFVRVDAEQLVNGIRFIPMKLKLSGVAPRG